MNSKYSSRRSPLALGWTRDPSGLWAYANDYHTVMDIIYNLLRNNMLSRDEGNEILDYFCQVDCRTSGATLIMLPETVDLLLPLRSLFLVTLIRLRLRALF
jgi:hypothetical protein